MYSAESVPVSVLGLSKLNNPHRKRPVTYALRYNQQVFPICTFQTIFINYFGKLVLKK